MAKFNKAAVLASIEATGMVPVYYDADVQRAKAVVKACYDGGVRLFEFTNRGDFAIDVFKEVVKYALTECPDMIVGVGSVVDAPTAALFIGYGANFVVGPCLNEEVARLCNRHLILYVPGCGSVSEISKAHELGCDVVKIFPAGQVGGPDFIKNVKAPMPWANIMATGAVEPTAENLKAWFSAGAYCVGMGSKLFPKEALQRGEWQTVEQLCREALSYIADGKK